MYDRATQMTQSTLKFTLLGIKVNKFVIIIQQYVSIIQT